jgi:hypothetical protein
MVEKVIFLDVLGLVDEEKCRDAEYTNNWTCSSSVNVTVGFTAGWMSLGKGSARSIDGCATTHGIRQYKPLSFQAETGKRI